MDETRASLLLRIRDSEDALAWAEFHEIYAPLLYRYARARGLSHADAEDVRATCYETLLRQIGDFRYEREKGGFKAWLRTLVHRRVVDLLRKRKEKVADSHALRALPSREDPDEVWEREWREHHLRHYLAKARERVSETVYTAFELLVTEGLPVAEVGERLDLNANQVYKAKSRVLAIVREEMERVEETTEGDP